MSFSDSLHRLQAAADFRQPGVHVERCTINRADLRELLNDWARLDSEARDRYHTQMGNAAKAVLASADTSAVKP